MFFEGNEKKVEVVVAEGSKNLRQRGFDFWKDVVQRSGAQILSSIQSDACDAYLLSESSLFVWDDHFTMITCGQTTLVKGVDAFLEAVPAEEVSSLIYERKNEYFPQLQKSDFYQDARELNRRLKGKALQFGNSDEHHLLLYSYNNGFKPPANDFTLEILMYDLQGAARETFSCSQQTVQTIQNKTKVHQIFDGFQVDDHLFDPCGYSLNAIKGQDYYTIHITPEDVGTYVSFETNVNLQQDIVPAVKRVLEIFQPRRFDVVVFSPSPIGKASEIPGFHVKNHVQSQLNNGYYLSFSHHFTPLIQASSPTEVIL